MDIGWNPAVLLVVLAAMMSLAAVIYRRFRSRAASSHAPPDSAGPPPNPVREQHRRAQTGQAKSTAHVFLSYASSDRPTAQAIAGALSAHGWSVWWDRTIPPGKSFDQVIEAALDAAGCVVVLWSNASVQSDWVKSEASEGARRRILVPALTEDVTIPLEFRRIQAASLVGWSPSRPHEGFDSLARSVAELLTPHDRRSLEAAHE